MGEIIEREGGERSEEEPCIAPSSEPLTGGGEGVLVNEPEFFALKEILLGLEPAVDDDAVLAP